MNKTILAHVVVDRGSHVTVANCTFQHLGGAALHLQVCSHKNNNRSHPFACRF